MTARLPQPGKDEGVWGDILNTFLSVEHDESGMLKFRAEAQNTFLPLSAKGSANGVAPLDAGARIPGGVMRPFNDRGVASPNTTYQAWDMVVYQGRRVLITQTVTSSASGFISGSAYVALDAITTWKAWDYGFRADGSQASAAANVTALQKAINDAYAAGGGTVQLPFGFAYINATIELKDRVWLRGVALFGSTLALTDNANCHVIKNHISTTGTASDKNAQFCGVIDLNIEGRKAFQGPGNWYGIYFDTNPFNTVGGDSYFDPMHLIQNVRVAKTKSDGIYLRGRSDTRVVNTKVAFAGGNAFRASFDTHFMGCIAERPAYAGFWMQNGSIQLTNCKAYTCGTGDTDDAGGGQDKSKGHGFVVDGATSEIVFAGCDSQQNTGYGLYLTGGVRGVLFQGTIAESSYQNGTAYASVCLDNASYCILDVASTNTTAVHGLRILGGASKNSIRLSHSGSGVAGAVSSDSVLVDNHIIANGQYVNPVVEIQSNKGQAGGYASLDSNGLVPVAQLPAGMGGVSRFFGNGFFGDGSDGTTVLDGSATPAWTVRVGAIYKLTQNVYLDTLTIDAGINLYTQGYILCVKNTLNGQGTISYNGFPATSATGGFAATSTFLRAGTAGGNGSANTTGQAATGIVSPQLPYGGAGGIGGAGSTTAGGTGGAAATPASSNGGLGLARVLPSAATGSAITGFGTIGQMAGGTGGGGGGGDGTNTGGGGGGGGGLVIVNCRILGGTLTFQALGGNGAAGTAGNAGGGGGGGGGCIIINTTVLADGASYTTQVQGGTGGAGSGSGTAGASGTSGRAFINIFA